MFDLSSKDGFCYFSHEGQTKRGSCEIASHVHHFLQLADDKGVKEVSLFCDVMDVLVKTKTPYFQQ